MKVYLKDYRDAIVEIEQLQSSPTHPKKKAVLITGNDLNTHFFSTKFTRGLPYVTIDGSKDYVADLLTYVPSEDTKFVIVTHTSLATIDRLLSHLTSDVLRLHLQGKSPISMAMPQFIFISDKKLKLSPSLKHTLIEVEI